MSLTKAAPQVQALVTSAQGRFGVAAKDLTTGETLQLNAEELYPLASTFKIPVLVELYRQADRGEVDVNERFEFTLADRMPGSGVLQTLAPGFALTLRDYAMLMIIVSDNSATDKVMHAIGRNSITPAMRDLGLDRTYVSRTCGQILATLAGYEVELPTPQQVQEILAVLRGGQQARTSWAYEESERNNVGTPTDMVRLLELVHNGEAASAEGCGHILEILRSQQLKQRLPLRLPPGVVTAHKTGTLPGVVNDAGLMYLDSGQACAIAVFSKDGADRNAGSETIAQIALAIYQALSS